MPDNSAEIAEIELMLNSGISETQVGQTKTKVDTKSLERRLAYLRATDDTLGATAKLKVIQVNLS